MRVTLGPTHNPGVEGLVQELSTIQKPPLPHTSKTQNKVQCEDPVFLDFRV